MLWRSTYRNLIPVGGLTADAPALYSYRSTDDLATVTDSGYFTEKQYELEVGDWIISDLSDGRHILQVSPVTSACEVTPTMGTKRVYVRKPADLVDAQSGIDYVIDGVIDVSGYEYEMPSGGLKLSGYGFGVSKLTSSTDNYTMFSSPVSGSGDLFTSGVEFTVTGTNSKVFDAQGATGNEAIEFYETNFVDCTSIGVLDNYRQLLASNVGFLGCYDGIEFVDSWAGIRVDTAIVINFQSGGTLFKAGAGFTISTRVITDINATIPSGATGFDFTASNFINDSSFQIIGANFSGGGSYVPNISANSTKVRFRNNTGITNTYIGSTWSISSAAATTFSLTGASGITKVLGTTTYTHDAWFSSSVDNAFVYDSTVPVKVDVNGTLSFTGSANKSFTATVRHWDDSASAYNDIDTITFTTNGGVSGTRAENVGIVSVIDLEQNDRVEIWVQNDTDTTSVTCDVGSRVVISERQS